MTDPAWTAAARAYAAMSQAERREYWERLGPEQRAALRAALDDQPPAVAAAPVRQRAPGSVTAKQLGCGCLALALFVGYLIARGPSSVVTSAPTPAAAVSSPWLPAAGRIWVGTTLYYGPQRMVVGVVRDIEASAHEHDGRRFQGVLVEMPGGSLEWKDREAIRTGDWWVRGDDPAAP